MNESAPNPSIHNAAVQRCCAAHQRSIEQSKAKFMNSQDLNLRAVLAYREAMPDLSGHQNICDFIACTAHGILLRVIDPIEGPKLLYAAQVALGCLRYEPKPQKQPAA